MKKLIIALFPLLLLISCGEPELTPVQEAIKQKIEGQLGELDYISFSNFELVDEIARRRKTIETRRILNRKKAEEFRNSGKPVNAGKKFEAAKKDGKVLEGINAIEQRLAEHDSLDVVELYRYKFSAVAKASGVNTEIKEMYVAITPDNRIIGMDYKKDATLKGGGSLLPGYHELFQ